MNISTTFLNALKHTSSDVEGQRSPEILLGQIYKVSLEDKGFLLPLAGGEFRLLNPFYYEWNPFPSYLLLYTLEGSALLTTRDNEVILDHEHLLFLDCSHAFRCFSVVEGNFLLIIAYLKLILPVVIRFPSVPVSHSACSS